MAEARFRSITIRLAAWFLIVGFVPLFAAATVLYVAADAALVGHEKEKLEALRDLKSEQVDAWLNERAGDIDAIVRDDEVRDLEALLAAPDGTPDAGRRLATARHLLERYVSPGTAWTRIEVVMPEDGRIALATANELVGHSRKDDLAFTRALASSAVAFGPIHRDEYGRPMLSLGRTIQCLSHGGRHVVGVLLADIDVERSLYRLLLDRAGMGTTGEALLVSEDGIALNELRWHGSAPLTLRIDAEPARRAAAGKRGVIAETDYRGEPVIAAYTHVRRLGWGLVVKRDVTEVLHPLGQVLRTLLVVAVSAFVGILLVAVFLSRRLTRPIRASAAAAERVARGEYDVRLEEEGSDELGLLGRAFNRMSASVAAQLRVRDGTSALGRTMLAGSRRELAETLVATVSDLTGASLVAVFERAAGDGTFTPTATVGLSADDLDRFDGTIREGQLGAALLGRTLVHVSSADGIPLRFRTIAGDAAPRELVALPLVVAGEVRAVLLAATLGTFDEPTRDVFASAQLGLSTALANLLESEETERLAFEVGQQNEELTATNEELQSQAEELSEQAAELRTLAVELDERRQQVQEADRLKSEFLSNMSHELRTPLNSVLALSQLMLSRGTGHDLAKESEYLTIIERNGRQLLNLINDILDLSKVEAGHVELRASSFEPSRTARRVAMTIRPLAEQKGLSLRLDQGETETMDGDEDRVAQILLNLLSNAVKFTDTGLVTLSVRDDADDVVFAVTDTGIGISSEDATHIFDEFRQVDGSATRRFEGTGLGLAISRKLARRMGGDVTVESEDGAGSTFSLRLPRRAAATRLGPKQARRLTSKPWDAGPVAASQDAAAPSTPAAAEGGGARILLVEDNPVAALQVRLALQQAGHVVSLATGGREALDALQAGVLPDAVLLDLMMPDVDGLAVLEAIRGERRTRAIPVLVLTAKELTDGDRSALDRHGVRHFVQKGSVDRDRLLALVTDLVTPKRRPGPPALSAPPTGATAGPASSTTASHTVLVVEDHPDSLTVVRALLDSLGLAHVSAADGEAGVRAAREHRPGLILMDVQLPGLSGSDAAHRIKTDPALSHVPVVALTARAMKGDREAFLDGGFDEYVSKPIDVEVLARTIRRWLPVAEDG